MSLEVKIARTPVELRAATRRWRADGYRYALVPTMGALHAGHLALVAEAFRHADAVAASIFINPRQFGKREDLSRYPRNEAEDCALLAKAGATLVYAPAPETMYPPGFSTTVALAGPAKAGLEDKFRPGFFPGVATIVSKLLAASEADFAMFGEKDYQQLKVVTQLARDLNLAAEIIAVPTVREGDGLALSSRNAYLSLEAACRRPAGLQHFDRGGTCDRQRRARFPRNGRGTAKAGKGWLQGRLCCLPECGNSCRRKIALRADAPPGRGMAGQNPADRQCAGVKVLGVVIPANASDPASLPSPPCGRRWRDAFQHRAG